MRRGHRSAHRAAILVCGALAAGLFGYGWTVRAARLSPQLVAEPAPPPPGAAWEATIHTHAGTATVRYFSGENAEVGDSSAPFLWAMLPVGLDAAEPGLILESGDHPPRVLGSIAPSRPLVPVPGGLEAGVQSGGRLLVLVDLARDLRLGHAEMPGGAP